MTILYRKVILGLSFWFLTIHAADSASTALDSLSLEDVRKSSTLVYNTFQSTFEPSARIIEDPLSKEKVGQISFEGRKVNVTYRATLSSPIEMLSNFNFSFAPLSEYGFSSSSQGHAGFIQSTDPIKDFVLKSILEYQREAQLKAEEMQIIVHGQSRGTGLGTLTATYLKNVYSENTSIYVLNHAPLPLFDRQSQQECNQKLGIGNVLNFICEEDGVLQLVERNYGNSFKRAGTDLPFSVASNPDFINRIGNYTHLSLPQGWQRILAVGAMSTFGITAKGWEGHMPESYFYSVDGLKKYRLDK